MPGKNQSMRAPLALVASSRPEVPAQSASSLHGRRSAVARFEDEDAGITGMTRSLDRRLLALNLQPAPSASQLGYMKVA